MRDDQDAWFAPKTFGYGAGLPVAWQGWALLVGYSALVLGLALALAQRNPVAFTVATLALTAALLVISARHTRGGWKWRWGGDA